MRLRKQRRIVILIKNKMTEKYINKLVEIKNLLTSDAKFDVITFKGLISRAEAIVEKKYGINSIYNQRLAQLKRDTGFAVYIDDIQNFVVLLDIVIDDLELSEKKEEEIYAPLLLEKKTNEIAEEVRAFNNKIFIVHGHNEAMKLSVARTIEKLKLEPIILHEQTNQGSTIIEKFFNHSNVGFALVLLSADDIGYSIKDGEKTSKLRARQNVIFELGFFTAKLGRKKVVALVEKKGEFELPSDIHGVIYILYDGIDGKWKYEVAKELMESGYNINVNKII